MMRPALPTFLILAATATGLSPSVALADEGMWLLNDFPKNEVNKKYSLMLTDAWLENVRLSSVRLAGGCSGSLVSPQGLVMTNHHCSHSCIEQLSTADKDFVKAGFYAKTPADEVKCPEIEIDELIEIKDVTDQINKVTSGLADQKFNETQKAEMSKIEKACATSDKLRCDVVTLYHGGSYHLYKYKRFQDVRLVFAPELAIAFFGGDPDNFNFPRYDLDVSFLRVYENGAPANIDHYFRWSPKGASDGDLVFVSGHPGGTNRGLTMAELEYQRDIALPWILMRLSEWRGVLTEFQRRSDESKRVSTKDLFSVENTLKAERGVFQALLDKALLNDKAAEENKLKAKIDGTTELKKKYGGAFEAIAHAEDDLKRVRSQVTMIERGYGMRCDLYDLAKDLVRAAEERPKSNEKRFREYRDSALPGLTQELFSDAPIYDDLEITKLTFSLTKLREELGPDHAFVKRVLGKEAPEDLAARLIKSTKLKDVALRKKLWEGGKKAIDASDDPMIKFAKLVDPDARVVRKKYEDEIESVVKRNSELVAKARFEVFGASTYPDATFTLRLSYGKVNGWDENGTWVKPVTTMRGAFDRATGRPPFELPKSWIDAQKSLDLGTPFNFVTTNDIIGGNSGSPVIDKEGRIVGLIFDGNIHSLGGDFGFDEKSNRAVAVHSQALLHALDRVYHTDRIVQEIRAKTTVGGL